jgi:MerR family copper efflux transcriptional regulator
MQISELARRAEVSIYSIRHWERLGLITSERRSSGYREFSESVIRELRFISMSRDCGFSLRQISEVLPLYRNKTLTTVQMIAMFEGRIAEIDAEIAKNRALRKQLVSHIGWFYKREKQAQKKSKFPSTQIQSKEVRTINKKKMKIK